MLHRMHHKYSSERIWDLFSYPSVPQGPVISEYEDAFYKVTKKYPSTQQVQQTENPQIKQQTPISATQTLQQATTLKPSQPHSKQQSNEQKSHLNNNKANQPLKYKKKHRPQATSKVRSSRGKSSNIELTHQDRCEIRRRMDQQRLSSRSLPDSKFRDYYGKQVMHNYGRENITMPGMIYGNYLKSQSINPHTGGNQPITYQTHQNAINFAKRCKQITEDDKLVYMKKANYKKWGFSQPTDGQKLAFAIDDAYQLLIHGKTPKKKIHPQILALVSDMHKNNIAQDRDIDQKKAYNKRHFDYNGHYLVDADDVKTPKIKCHSFDRSLHESRSKKIRQQRRLKKIQYLEKTKNDMKAGVWSPSRQETIRQPVQYRQHATKNAKDQKSNSMLIQSTDSSKTIPFSNNQNKSQTDCIQKTMRKLSQNPTAFSKLHQYEGEQQLSCSQGLQKNPRYYKGLTLKALDHIRPAGI